MSDHDSETTGTTSDPSTGSRTGPSTSSGGRRPQQRRSGELGFVELLRWAWRQLTSMRTALILLLLLAIAAIPGSIIPQEGVDALKTSRWQDEHPKLTPIYERLGLFSVYDTPWFSAIYVLLIISLVGCILPRLRVYWRSFRAKPPKTPRRLDRLPDHARYESRLPADEVLAAARRELRKRRYRIVDADDSVAAERGRLREAGNLLFHFSLLIVLAAFAMGSLFGYKGGVIVLVGNGFSNNLTQYDEFEPGSLFSPGRMSPFSFDITDFDVTWDQDGPTQGTARSFVSHIDYRESPGDEPESYDLRVNHPLNIGNTDVFLIGHGYAPVITVRDGDGNVAYSGPTIFLPEDTSFRSFGVVQVPDAAPTQIGLEGEFYPTYAFTEETGPWSVWGEPDNPVLSMLAYTGDLGMDAGESKSVYSLDKSNLKVLKKKDGSMFRVDLAMGDTVDLPEGAGTVTFDGLRQWNKVQISQTPGIWLALLGVCLALLGLMGSLFVRPRRVWIRARAGAGGLTVVEIGCLDRSNGGDPAEEVAGLVRSLRGPEDDDADQEHTETQPGRGVMEGSVVGFTAVGDDETVGDDDRAGSEHQGAAPEAGDSAGPTPGSSTPESSREDER